MSINGKNISVLSVDDDFINLKLINSILKKSDSVSQVYDAKNGDEALRILNINPHINIVLLDVAMPIMGGIEMLQIMRNNPKLWHIPVIILTTDETKKQQALNEGANDFIMKPVQDVELFKKIERLINLTS